MRKPSARIVVAALAIPLFGGFATYAAAQVSTRPSPQVVVPPVRATSATAKTPSSVETSSTLPGHDANDDRSQLRNGELRNEDANTSSTTPGHDVNDDRGGVQSGGVQSGGVESGVSNRGPGSGSDDPANHDVNDDHGDDTVTSISVPTTAGTTPATTPTSVDDHGGDSGNGGSGRSGRDG
jgi:hypothetical protein